MFHLVLCCAMCMCVSVCVCLCVCLSVCREAPDMEDRLQSLLKVSLRKLARGVLDKFRVEAGIV